LLKSLSTGTENVDVKKSPFLIGNKHLKRLGYGSDKNRPDPTGSGSPTLSGAMVYLDGSMVEHFLPGIIKLPLSRIVQKPLLSQADCLFSRGMNP
jgi:hypothetical protein